MTSIGNRIVVGVDETEGALAAVDVAATEAALRGRPLHIVYADPFATPDSTTAQRLPDDESGRLVSAAMARARATEPGIIVTGEVARGFAQPVLIAESRVAELVVVGHRDAGALDRLLTEPVAAEVEVGTACPLMMVRGTVEGDGPVVVGVDGSPSSQAAVAFAFAEADLRERRLVMVHAWSLPGPHAVDGTLPVDFVTGSVAAGAQRLVAEAAAGWREKYPTVSVEEAVVHGHPRQVMTETANGASLIVVGIRGRTERPIIRLGSVSRHLLHHAPCPVAIVPDPGE